MQAVADTTIIVQTERLVTSWVAPATIVLVAFLIGFIFERIILRHLRKLAARTEWKGDEVFINALHGVVTVLSLFIGGYVASFIMPLPANIVALLQKAMMILIILSGTVILARIAVGFVGMSSSKDDGKLPSASIINYVTNAIVYLIGILIILQSLGISITPLLTALGVGGLAVALALQDTLSNLFAGIHIIASKKIRTGDFVRLESGEEGFVEDISWRTTSIRALANYHFIVPNNKLSTMIVTDYDQPQQEMSTLIDVGVSYDSDLEHVERVTIEVGKQTLQAVTGAVAEFEPFIRYKQFGDSSINFSVILRVKTYVDQYLLKHEFVKRLHARYNQEGIEIPFPIRTVYMRNRTTQDR